MNTTPSPDNYSRFYMIFPENSPMNRENYPITLTLPADKKFPLDLIGIMNKTKRFLSFEQSEVKGTTTPQCSGTSCVCQNCPEPEVICSGIGCKEKDASYSTYGITCNNSLCVVSNDITYSMYPLYPVDMCLPQYDPKFKFMKYISSEKITTKDLQENNSIIQELFKEGETIPPLDLLKLPNLVLFSVTFPIRDFNTQDKFAELYDIITYTNNFITLLKYDGLVQHNIASLQRVIKKNNLQKLELKTIQKGKQLSTKKPISREIMNDVMEGKIPTRRPNILMERYTEGEEIMVKTINVPITSRDDTLMISDILLVPEPDKQTTPTKKQQLSGFQIFLIILVIIIVVIAIVALFSRRDDGNKSNVQSKKKK